MRSGPSLYEINTWPWLESLGRRFNRTVQLGDVPAEVWDEIGSWQFDVVWLMGVWQRSPEGERIARQIPELQVEYRNALPDVTDADIVGSPYCVHSYVVDEHLGGPEGLQAARRELANRGMAMILDFVPNHVARDHPWTRDHPEYFIHEEDGSIACGRDPYFPPWTDTAQLNVFDAGLRAASIDTLKSIAAQCDGVRCDMAMLVLNEVFRKTWGERAGAMPATEFWSDALAAVHAISPEFVFGGEVYWGMEATMQALGFEYCYDKDLYDKLLRDDAGAVLERLSSDISYQRKLLRFLENHDESRAAKAFGERERAAAAVIATVLGAKLFHEGQIDGWTVKTPVQLGRRLDEPRNTELCDFYWLLLHTCRDPLFHDGEWALAERTGWPDNQSHRNILAWTWSLDEQRAIVAVNYSGGAAQARVHVAWDDLTGKTWRLADVLTSEVYARSGDELTSEGLYVDLPAWGLHILRFSGAA